MHPWTLFHTFNFKSRMIYVGVNNFSNDDHPLTPRLGGLLNPCRYTLKTSIKEQVFGGGGGGVGVQADFVLIYTLGVFCKISLKMFLRCS